MRIRSISGRANAMFTGRHEDRSERCRWALGLLRTLIMIVGSDRWVAMGFNGASCRWAEHLYRCGALIAAALGYAGARRRGYDKPLVFAPRTAGRVAPSHRAQTLAKERPAGYGDVGGGTKAPLSAAKSRANSIVEGSSRSGPMRCTPAGSLSPVTPIGAAVGDRFDWTASPAKNICCDYGTDLPRSVSGFTPRSLAIPRHLPLDKKTRRALLAAMSSRLCSSRDPRRVQGGSRDAVEGCAAVAV